jgi:hypothetical protein
VLYDVRTRRVARRSATNNIHKGSVIGCTVTTPPVALLVRPSGAMAWSEPAGDDGKIAIHAVDAAGQYQTLDAAPDVDAASLHAVDAGTIAWTRAGQLQTATLP